MIKEEDRKDSFTVGLMWTASKWNEEVTKTLLKLFSFIYNKSFIYLKHLYSDLPFPFWECSNIRPLDTVEENSPPYRLPLVSAYRNITIQFLIDFFS